MREAEQRVSGASVDKLAEQVLRYAAFCVEGGVPGAVVTEAFLRAAVAIAVTDLGVELTAINLREAAEQLSLTDEGGAPAIVPSYQ